MKHNPLATLMQLAEEAQQATARLLAGERRNEQQLVAQLRLLERYRLEYGERLDQLSDAGITRGALDDYQRFMRSLDAAIDTARQGLSVQVGKVAQYQARWREERGRQVAFSTLLERREAKAQRLEARGEARRQDEFSINQFLRSRHSSTSESQ